MSVDSKSFLSGATLKVNDYAANYQDINQFYSSVDTLTLPRLQDLSFESDLSYFYEVEKVLSYIYTISQRPYINTKTNDIIVRSDVASQLNETDRLMTFQDTSLWKKKGNELSPEYVHFHEYVDQIAIYENRFIVYLLNLINDDLIREQVFYVSTLNKFDFKNSDLSFDQLRQEEAVRLLNRLINIVNRIKDTRFYKEVSKVKAKMDNVLPTNILMQNPLYRRCYIFYREFISSTDYEKTNQQLLCYYYVQILRYLKRKDYTLTSGEEPTYNKTKKQFKIPSSITLESKEESISISLEKSNVGYYLIFTNKFLSCNVEYRNALVCLMDNWHAPILEYHGKEKLDSITYLTIWNLSILDESRLITLYNMHPEKELVARFIDSHTSIIEGNKDIYSKYCPICQKNTIKQLDNGLYQCDSCHSTYYLDKNSETIITDISLLDVRTNA